MLDESTSKNTLFPVFNVSGVVPKTVIVFSEKPGENDHKPQPLKNQWPSSVSRVFQFVQPGGVFLSECVCVCVLVSVVV
jgi:hypothetical protein